MSKEEILKLVEKENPDNPIEFVNSIVRDLAINKLNDYIYNCKECDISNCTSRTYASGNSNASIMIILDQAEDNDNINPLNTEAGEILLNTLDKLGVYEEDLFTMNAINCFPHRESGEKRPPTKKERENCRHFLDYAIKAVDPLLIISLGGIAVNTINEEIGKVGIKQIRGQWFYYKGIPVMPTFHPSFFTEVKEWSSEELSESYKKQCEEDIKNGIDYMNENYWGK